MSPRPKPVPLLYRWKTNVIQIPLLTLMTVICGSISLLASFADKGGRLQHRVARFWARAVVWGTGCPLIVRGAENLKKYPVAVYASNHTSYMDTPVIFAALPFQFRILAKKELWPIAFIGWYLDRSGQIPIPVASTSSTPRWQATCHPTTRSSTPNTAMHWRHTGSRYREFISRPHVPLGGLANWLDESGEREAYWAQLREAFDPASLGELPCSTGLDLGWDGTLWDCGLPPGRRLQDRGGAA